MNFSIFSRCYACVRVFGNAHVLMLLPVHSSYLMRTMCQCSFHFISLCVYAHVYLYMLIAQIKHFCIRYSKFVVWLCASECVRACSFVVKKKNTNVHLSSLCDCVRGNTCVSLRHARLLNWRYTIRIHSFVARVARFSHAIYTITSVWLVWFVGFPDIILISNGLWLSRRTTVVEQSTRIIASDHYQKRRKKRNDRKKLH